MRETLMSVLYIIRGGSRFKYRTACRVVVSIFLYHFSKIKLVSGTKIRVVCLFFNFHYFSVSIGY